MQVKNLRIIPLLILVTMLAFSVRLVDVVTGISSFSGSAAARDIEEQSARIMAGKEPASGDSASDDSKAEEEHAGGLVFQDEGDEVKKEGEHEEANKEADKDEDYDDEKESPLWRDPTDEDPGYTAVRGELFDELSKRRKNIEAGEKRMATRDALLKAAEQELDRKYQELSQLRQEIERLLKKQSGEEDARIRSLVKIYEGMKPKDAARIFDTLDIDILVSVMSQMSERKLSPILAAMNPERARTVTIMLAEQGSLPTLPRVN